MKRFRFNSRLVITVVLVATVSAACVKKGEGAVKINPIEANLVFGVKPPPAIAPLPAQVEPDLTPEIATDINIPPPGTGLGLNLPTVKDCPDAAVTAVVETPSDVNITGQPLVGVARWKHSGFATINGKQAPFTGFERRVVRNFKQESATVSTFETLQPIGNTGQFLQSTFRVNTAGVQQGVDPPIGNGVPAPPPVYAPDAGVVLTELRTLDRAGGNVGTPFTPVTGILLLPLPVDAGAQWESIAVDPKSGQTVIHNATIDRRQRIDACGDLVDGWHITATQVIASARNAEPQVAYFGYDYIVAPQFGGMIIDERLTQPDPLGENNPLGETPTPVDLDYTLGQLKPDVLPTN